MPYLSTGIIATKVRGVLAAQDVLLFAKNNPASVRGVGVDNLGFIKVHFINGPSMPIGRLKEDYMTHFGDLAISQWKITGGWELDPPITSKHGNLCACLGLNVVLRIMSASEDGAGHTAGGRSMQHVRAVPA